MAPVTTDIPMVAAILPTPLPLSCEPLRCELWRAVDSPPELLEPLLPLELERPVLREALERDEPLRELPPLRDVPLRPLLLRELPLRELPELPPLRELPLLRGLPLLRELPELPPLRELALRELPLLLELPLLRELRLLDDERPRLSPRLDVPRSVETDMFTSLWWTYPRAKTRAVMQVCGDRVTHSAACRFS